MPSEFEKELAAIEAEQAKLNHQATQQAHQGSWLEQQQQQLAERRQIAEIRAKAAGALDPHRNAAPPRNTPVEPSGEEVAAYLQHRGLTPDALQHMNPGQRLSALRDAKQHAQRRQVDAQRTQYIR